MKKHYRDSNKNKYIMFKYFYQLLSGFFFKYVMLTIKLPKDAIDTVVYTDNIDKMSNKEQAKLITQQVKLEIKNKNKLEKEQLRNKELQEKKMKQSIKKQKKADK